MKLKHTPGPWTVFAEPEETGPGLPSQIPAEDGWPFIVAAPDRGLGYNRIHAACSVQSIADARLIAAAPDMLAGLKGLLQLHIAHHNHPDHAAMRALIRQIEGEE